MRVGMVCYASVGGSGVVATELAKALADRGHDVHLISSEPPFRWQGGVARLHFHRVTVPSYPLFREPQYLLALATTIAHISDEQRLEIVHAHYAVPHATAAYLAQQMLASASRPARPKTVTTLHGTDITLVGSDRSYAWAVGFSIERSDIVTAVSQSLKESTVSSLGIHREIDVIPNFLDCVEYQQRFDAKLRAQLAPAGTDALIVHMSNFRPVKRVAAVIDVFRLIRREVPARLLLIGDGPDRAAVERRVEDYGLTDHVVFVGEERDPLRWLSVADLFLLPSVQESFGLAALEAMACERPVAASAVGGLPEIIDDQVGTLFRPADPADLAARLHALLVRPDLAEAGRRARARVLERWSLRRLALRHVEIYEMLLRGDC